MFSAEHEKHNSLPELKGTKGDSAGDGAVTTSARLALGRHRQGKALRARSGGAPQQLALANSCSPVVSAKAQELADAP